MLRHLLALLVLEHVALALEALNDERVEIMLGHRVYNEWLL